MGISLPLEATNGPHSSVYVSGNFKEAQKLLLIIQGSGRVRVGVWGCALCINKNLDEGTVLPYIKMATENGYGVIVLNPNENMHNATLIPGSESPVNHVAYVFEHVILPAFKDSTLEVVAHSNGGRALMLFLGR